MMKKQRTVFISWKYRIVFIIWELMMIGIHLIPYIPGLTEKQHEKFMGYQLGILIPLTGLVVPLIFISIISRRYAIEKTLIQDNYISAELDYLNQYKKSQEQTRAFRHDIINNLSLLSALYEEENYKDAEEHLGSLLGDVSAMSPKYVTGDEMLDCIVGIKASKMHEEGIDFIVEGMIDGGLGMKPVDVCSVFANAMDNAIEACEKLSEDSNKWIHLSVKKTDRFFAVKLSNTMLPEVDKTVTSKLFAGSERVTTKKDKFLHGFGTQNMKATISRYGGMESVETENGVFNLTIMIPRNN
jgi:sensor histidine kinase regulating citrate/malate metabolism